ncbi:hypothetical protein H8959_015940 [Pygathrix nigripes]
MRKCLTCNRQAAFDGSCYGSSYVLPGETGPHRWQYLVGFTRMEEHFRNLPTRSSVAELECKPGASDAKSRLLTAHWRRWNHLHCACISARHTGAQ